MMEFSLMMLIQNFDGGRKTLGGEPSGVALKRHINLWEWLITWMYNRELGSIIKHFDHFYWPG